MPPGVHLLKFGSNYTAQKGRRSLANALKLERKMAPKLECKMEPNLERKMKQNLERKMKSKQERRNGPGVARTLKGPVINK